MTKEEPVKELPKRAGVKEKVAREALNTFIQVATERLKRVKG
jgi:nucleoid DNA-binding protein